jgi:hypothetical protein
MTTISKEVDVMHFERSIVDKKPKLTLQVFFQF